MIDGIINVYKEQGFTSHDVVAKLRGILHQKKIGHTGTLDPDAVGVLPVCLGSGTKLCDMLTDTDKVYRATMLLGLSTDTQDTSGAILSECAAALKDGEQACAGPLKASGAIADTYAAAPKQSPLLTDEAAGMPEILLDADAIRAAIHSFVGAYDQVPPMYSALKVNGRKLYELAREGREVERAPRRVEIHEIVIERMETVEEVIAGIPFKAAPPKLPKIQVTMTVRCSKGTYIRTLCHDIGHKLGTGGCMSALARIQVGVFGLESAMTLKEVEAAVSAGTFPEKVTPVDAMFEALPAMTVDAFGGRLLRNGNPLPQTAVLFAGGRHDGAEAALEDGARVRVYDMEGRFTAIYAYHRKQREFKVVKMFTVHS